MRLIPTTILTGFLGAGKTTLLKRVLTEAHGRKIAVIENEIGAENIDGEILVADSPEQIIQMTNGCICCTIREDLRSTLRDLAERRRSGQIHFDQVVLETTGLADPGPVAQTFFVDEEMARCYLLDSIITLVDARHAADTLDERREARRQVGFADQIFISKTDLVTPGELDGLARRLSRMNPRAPQKIVHFGQVPISEVFDLRGFNLHAHLEIDPNFLRQQDDGHFHQPGGSCDHPSHRHGGDDVESFVFRTNRPFDPARLGAFLAAVANGYGPRLLRYKGVLYVRGIERKVIFQGVQQLTNSDLGPHWVDGETRGSKLVFIGIELPHDMFLQCLERCLC